jgi:hypothetical protein
MSEKLYVTFGNEEKYRITQDTLIAYLENATIKFPLPEASSTLLQDIANIRTVNPVKLDAVKSRLIATGFQEPNALTMASVLLQVAELENIDPLDYFYFNEASLKLAVDTYETINTFRPKGNLIGLTAPINNKKSRYRKLIQP